MVSTHSRSRLCSATTFQDRDLDLGQQNSQAMLHSLLIVNDEQYVLLGRYFQADSTLETRKQYEASLLQACTQQLPSSWSSSTAMGMSGDQLVCCSDQFVVIRAIGEFRVFLAGNEEYDELMRTCAWCCWHLNAYCMSTQTKLNGRIGDRALVQRVPRQSPRF